MTSEARISSATSVKGVGLKSGTSKAKARRRRGSGGRGTGRLRGKRVRKLRLRRRRRMGRGQLRLRRRLRGKGQRARLRARRRRKALPVVEAAPPPPPPPPEPEEPGYRRGVNIVGFVRAEMGIGESSRLAARSLDAAGIPFDMMNFPITKIRMEDLTWAHKEVEHPDFKANVFHMNADTMRSVHHYFGQGLFDGRRNIGYWHWELPDFPDEFCNGFELVDEVWVPSNYVVNCIAPKSPVPVIRIPHGIEVHYPPGLNRGSFGLPGDRFLFFSMFDTLSYQRRKNPQGAIAAFKMAFDPNDASVGLVVKLNHSQANPDDLERLHQQVQGFSNIYILDQIMTRGEVNALLACTDSFVSLHRAEGFGLGLAEAMYLGKPVIGTHWSGNTDFMNASNSCPIGFSLVQVGEDWGPYKSYQTWAEPDLEHAAHSMREVRFNEAFRMDIAARGQATIRGEFSPAAVGNRMRIRLKELGVL
ncbi:glycosyltransferase [Paenibacillus koleovorans]|uniref:glycosyltransferase n=1 Tax=Paenibacillus koleovorans TaxID=121608 RepID=UPI001FE41258|nr:glycosyltransferase [Paenibacillus koleovorans]